ncbi:DUF2887 domain-containing protein [Thiorhodospira sibirica]|uniref:DUF2887 domain-containing protein n=1 Tax=Thiorhodospira sibirica TaxID=154347 RepID=UPI00022C5E70|nr:DUF2887 domain-containing protein [Thiorhodospira sibirica]
MRTDSLFYQLFLQNPAFALQLLGLSDSGAGYRFTSVEVKQTSSWERVAPATHIF